MSKKWHNELHEILNDSGISDRRIASFIEDRIPNDEGPIFDYKEDLYLRSEEDPEKDNGFKASFIKSVSALANTISESQHRYLFIGFDDSGIFQGASFQSPVLKDSSHIIKMDDAEIRNIVENYLYPEPDFEKYKIEFDGNEGLVLEVSSVERPPSIIQKTIRISQGKQILAAKGSAYTRKGSKTTVMDHSDFRKIIELREKIVEDKIREFAEDLDKVVGIPSNQLSNLNLSVTSSEDGMPVEEVVTTDAAKDINEELTTAVKSWNSSGELLSSRESIYRFYQRAEDLELDNEKIEFLLRSCLDNWLPGAEWIRQFDGNNKQIYKSIIEENSFPAIVVVEKLLLLEGETELLEKISNDPDLGYGQSQAERYANESKKDLIDRLEVLNLDYFTYNETRHDLKDLLSDKEKTGKIMRQVVDDVSEEDLDFHRKKLRKIEYVRLANELR